VSEKLTCPSSAGGPGATLLGILGPGGRVIFTPHGPRVDEALRTELAGADDGPLEARFRFAAPCVRSSCVFWDGSCRAIDAAHEDFDAATPSDVDSLPRCGIRESCRWWAQEGAAACRVCPYVRTA